MIVIRNYVHLASIPCALVDCELLIKQRRNKNQSHFDSQSQQSQISQGAIKNFEARIINLHVVETNLLSQYQSKLIETSLHYFPGSLDNSSAALEVRSPLIPPPPPPLPPSFSALGKGEEKKTKR